MNKTKNKKTVTIGIPTHNEERNIAALLKSILLQTGDNFIINSILVVCDGCTDNTATIVKKFSSKNKLVKLVEDTERKGKNYRLNQLYKNLSSDIFIAFDADAVLVNNHVVSELVKEFENKKIGLVGGRVIQRSQNTLIGKALIAQEYFWTKVIMGIRNGQNVHSHTGPISAGTREFLRKTIIPATLPDDHFLYFQAIKRGFGYRHAKDACVFINVPSTYSDYMKQRTRFLNAGEDIKSYFGELVIPEYYIPYQTKIWAYWQAFITHPLYLPLALVLVALHKISSFKYSEANANGLWTQIQSSK